MQSELKQLTQKVLEKLHESGWSDNNILLEPYALHEHKLFRPDIVLTYNLFPIAIIELKKGLSSLDVIYEQLAGYSHAYGIDNLFLMDDEKIFEIGKRAGELLPRTKFPSPDELWRSSGNASGHAAALVYPPAATRQQQPRLYQAEAISRSVEAALSGEKLQLISMPAGSGKSYVGLQIVWKLLKSGFSAKALVLTERIVLKEQLKNIFSASFEKISTLDADVNPDNADPGLTPRVSVELTNNVFRKLDSLQAPSLIYDLVIIDDLSLTGKTNAAQIVNYFPEATVIAFSNFPPHGAKYGPFAGKLVFQISVEDLIAIYPVMPPDGFYSVRLNEIAETRTGVTFKKAELSGPSGFTETLLITARNLHLDGTLVLEEARTVNPGIERANIEQYLIQPGDILLSAIGAKIKIVLVPASFGEKAIFSSSVMRIRVRSGAAAPAEVYEFLRSEVGQTSLRRHTKGAAQQFIASRDISQIDVFLHKVKEAPEPEPEKLTSVSEVLRLLKTEILPQFEIIHEEEKADTPPTVSIDVVAGMLKKITEDLIPLSLEEKVIMQYPMPIALAYRRFRDSRFNAYEQVSRLRDLFEAASFFIYNIVLADACQNLYKVDSGKYYISDGGTRKAYNSFSMAKRVEFVEHILKTAKSNKGEDLFMPELIETQFVFLAKNLQDEFRNSISHTATATESRVRSIIRQFQPVAEEMLSDLEFLIDYQLVRIPSFRIERGNLVRQMEIYKGTVPELVEQITENFQINVSVEHDHLVLLNSENNILDCHPLYQLHSSKNTRYETHLCFFKQKKTGEQKLEGESVNGAFEIELDGFDEFELLQKHLTPE